ncbi:BQ5605_C009g05745 [Microbotryum silenes-dioicae]|uniref:BQ5605_C009g05745 protein n=1 Tax=Microbotryum silenes-dioicae TaxID=796604 RepID=A0A2X0P9E5_9BASI|nr:BQ5605_C009g05745 [Microbotryum silenes-dioicae]
MAGSKTTQTLNTDNPDSKEFWEKSAEEAKEVKAIHEQSKDPRSKAGDDAAAATPTINYNNEPLPAGEVHAYHEHAAKVWTTAIILNSIVLILFSEWAVGVVMVRRKTHSLMKDWAWDRERKRGTNPNVSAFESVEWMNSVLSTVWPMLDPDLFVAGVDLLEDALKMLSPSVVRTVRIDSVDQGLNAMRILGIRRLPDDFDITESPFASQVDPTGPHLEEHKALDNAAPGQYVNIEAEFAYRRLPKSKSENAHLVIHMGLGVKKVLKVELPVLCELSGLYGKIRLRLEMIAEPPFVRHVKFSFPIFPSIEIVAKPLRAIDVMSLPGFKPFILSSINSVLYHFVAPQSYELDLSRFFLGSNVAMKTRSVGVVCVAIHKAQNLTASDVRGTSDGFVNVSFVHSGKVLFSTRVVPKTLNPVWEEVIFLRITDDEIDEQDRIRFTVLDWDRFSKNDVIGMTSISLTHLVNNPGVWDQSTIGLEHNGQVEAGTLSYSAAFFPLATMTAPTTEVQADDPMAQVKATKAKPMFADRGQATDDSRSSAYAQRMREMLDGRMPINPAQPTGILAFQVHQLAELECGDERSEKKKAVSTPSSYCVVYLNAEKLYQTRVKPLSAQPYVNAGSEAFCRDWTRARIDIAVMDARDREADVLIGFISLQLRDIFATRSQVTKWLPLLGGAGHGRLRFSLLFKPLDIVLPKPLLEWSIGCFEIVQAKLSNLSEEMTARLHVSAEGQGSVTSSSSESLLFQAGSETTSLSFDLSESLRVPILTRLHPLQFKVQSVRTLRGSETVWYAPLWLNDYAYEGEEEMELHLYPTHETCNPTSPSLPYQPRYKKHKVKIPKEQGKIPESSNNLYPTTSRTYDSPKQPFVARSGETSRSTASDEGSYPVLHITLRWKAGMSANHRDIILGASAATRDSFTLWLHRHDFAVKERKRSERDADAASALLSGLSNEPGWDESESSDDEELGTEIETMRRRSASGGVDILMRKLKGTKEGKGTTMKWIGSNLKVRAHYPAPTCDGALHLTAFAHPCQIAGHKVKKSIGSSKSVDGPIPETEVVSSF